MEFTAEMIAGFLGGEIVGDSGAAVHTVSSIEEGKPGSLAYLTNPKYEPFLYTTHASIVLVDKSFMPSQPVAATLVKVDDAAACVLRLLEMYNAAKPRRRGISPRASIAEGAEVGKDCYVGDFAVVEAGAKIGRGAQIYPQCYVGAGSSVGEETILYAGVKIYEYTPGFVHAKIFVSDDEKAVVGTINLDFRSLYLHFECAVYLYRNQAVEAVEKDFQKTLLECGEIREEDCRRYPPMKRLAGAGLRLFAPLM